MTRPSDNHPWYGRGGRDSSAPPQPMSHPRTIRDELRDIEISKADIQNARQSRNRLPNQDPSRSSLGNGAAIRKPVRYD